MFTHMCLHMVLYVLEGTSIYTPSTTAYIISNLLWVMIILTSIFGAFSAVIGLYFSFVHNLSSGAVIVLTTTVLFIITFIFAPKQGILWRSIKSWKNKTALQD